MYVDENIKISKDIPEKVKDDLKELDKYYAADDWYGFDTWLMDAEPTFRSLMADKKLSVHDYKMILRKYRV